MSDQIDRELGELMRLERISHLPTVPAPGVIWWKAQLLEKRRKQQQALLPVRFFRMTSVAAIYAAVLMLLYLAAQLGTIKPARLAFAGVLFLTMHLASMWVHWRISAKTK